MTEFKMRIDLSEWLLKPQMKREGRRIEYKILFLTFDILKNKKKR